MKAARSTGDLETGAGDQCDVGGGLGDRPVQPVDPAGGVVDIGQHVAAAERVFAGVLYTDLAESTPQAAAIGDRRWREFLEVHNNASVRQIERHGGQLVKSTGDGVLAVFDGPARAVRCAQAIVGDVRQLGCDAYAGLHAGEVELLGDDIAGIAVHIAARVMSHAARGEVQVSRTITDLVAGSGLRFERTAA